MFSSILRQYYHEINKLQLNNVDNLIAFYTGVAPPSEDEEYMDEEPEMAPPSSDESIGGLSDNDDDDPIYIIKIRKAAKQAIDSGAYQYLLPNDILC